MNRIALIVLCLVSLLAASAATAASAIAEEPIFEKVIVVPLKEGEKIPFSETGGKVKLETTEKAKILCATTAASGSVNGPSAMSLGAITLKGCEGFAAKCTSAGAAEGEVITSGFEGKLGNLKSGSTPGIAFVGAKEVDAEFTCGATTVKLSGGVVGPITLAGAPVSRFTLTYKATAGIQLFENLFGGPLDTLSLATNGGKAVQAGVTAKLILKLSQPLEVTAA